MAPVILQGQQGTQAWLNVKAGVITGTRFAAAMSRKDTAAYRGLVADLAWEMVFGASEPEERFVSRAMQEGIEREPESLEWYRFRTEASCYQPMFVLHAVHDFIGCSPDFLVNDDGMVQAKNPGRRAHLEVMQTRKLPSQYRWQVQGELMVTQRDWSDFVSYLPPLGGEVIRVLPNKDDHAALIAACIEVQREAAELAAQIQDRKAA
jgi:hypothetical protein